MAKDEVPVVLELAPLPREQQGPFLLLGIPKEAGPEQVEAHWAQRVIWSRKNQIGVSLADINWAREVINDPERRVKADSTSLNPDTTERVLQRLAEQFGVAEPAGPIWQPLDLERPLDDQRLPVAIPDANQVRAAIHVPEVPDEAPAVARLLEEFCRRPLDPWAVDLLPTDPAETSPHGAAWETPCDE